MATETYSPNILCSKIGEKEDDGLKSEILEEKVMEYGGNKVKEVETGTDQPLEITKGQVADTVNKELETGKVTDESETFLQALSVPMVNTPESCKATTVAYFEEGQGLNDVPKDIAKEEAIDPQEASENCENGGKRKREQNPEENVSKVVQSYSEIEQEEDTEEIKPSVETEKKTKLQGLFQAKTTDDCISTKTEPEDGTPENEVKNDEVTIEGDDSHKIPMVKQACEETVSEKEDESKKDSKLSESSSVTQNENETESKDEDQEKKEAGDITSDPQEASEKCEHGAKDEEEQKSEENVNKIVKSSEIEQEEDTEEIKPSVEVEEKTEQKGLLHDITDDTESQAESAEHEVKSDKAIRSDDGQMEKSDNPPVKEICEAVNTEKASEKCVDEEKEKTEQKQEESANKNVESFSESGQEDTEEIKPSIDSDEKEQVKIAEHKERQGKEVIESDDGQKEYSENLSIKETLEESHSEKVDFKGVEVSEKDEEQEKEQDLSMSLQDQGDENITCTQITTSIEDLQEKNYDGEGKEPKFVKTEECIEEGTEEIKRSVETEEKTELQGLFQAKTTDGCITTQTESQVESAGHEVKGDEAIESDGGQEKKSDIQEVGEVCEETSTEKAEYEEEVKHSDSSNTEINEKTAEILGKDEDQETKRDGNMLEKEQSEDVVPSSQDTTFEAGLQEKNHHSEPEVIKTKESIEDIEEINTSVQTAEETEQQKLTHAITTDICISTKTESENGTPENEVKNDEVAFESDDSHKSPMVKEACEEIVSEKADESKENSKPSESSRNEKETESKDEDQGKKEAVDITLDPQELSEKCEHGAKDEKEQKPEESVNKNVQSCSEVEQEKDTEEVKSSIEVEEKTPQVGTTEHEDEDKVIESDDLKEMIDSPSIKEVCEETGSETIVYKEVKHSDSSDTEIKSGSQLVKEVCEETVLEKVESEEGLKLPNSSDMVLNENEIVSKVEDQENEEVYVSGKGQGGGDDVTSSPNATCEDIKEKTIGQHVTTDAYFEEEQALSSMPKEILKEEAEDKSCDAQKASEQYENEAKEKIEQKPEECVNTIVRSFSITENTEELKPSVETDEKEQVMYEEGQEEEVMERADGRKEDSDNLSIKKVCEETQSEEVEFEGVKISDKDEDQEKEQELSMSEKSQGGGDYVTSLQNATTVAYFQEEQGLNATHKDILKEEAEDKTIDPQEASEKSEDGAKNEKEEKPEESVNKIVESCSEIEQEENTEESKPSVETENTGQQGLLHDITADGCITAQTEYQVKSAQHVVKSDKDIQSDDGQKENSESPSVKEVCEETGSEKVEFKEEANHFESTNTEIKSESPTVKEVCEQTVLEKAEPEEGLKLSESSDMALNEDEIVSKVEDQEKEQEVHVSGKGQGGGDDVTGSNNATCEDTKETTIAQQPVEILKEEAEDKSNGAQEASEQYENEAKDKIEQKPEECVDTIVSSFSEIENTEEIKPSVETHEKDQVCEESHSEKVEFEGVELSNKDKDLEKEEEVTMSEQDQGKDDVTNSQDATSTEDLQTRNYDGEGKEPELVRTREFIEEDIEEMRSSAERKEVKQQELLHDITTDVETDEKEQECEESRSEAIESDGDRKEKSDNPSVKEVCEENDLKKNASEEGIKLSESSSMMQNENEIQSKDEDQEKEQELCMSEKSLGGGDSVTSSQNAFSEVTEEMSFQHATAVAYFQEEQGLNATPKDIQKEQAEDTTTEEVKPSVETTDDCIIAQTKSQVESAEHEVKGDKVVQSDDSLKENLDGPSVKEVSEEIDSEKVEYKEEVKQSDSSNTKINSGSPICEEAVSEKAESEEGLKLSESSNMALNEDETTSKFEDQEKEEVYVLEKGQGGGDYITSSEPATCEDIKETTVDQHVNTEANFEEGQALSSMPKEILEEEAEGKSSDAQEASERDENGTKDKIATLSKDEDQENEKELSTLATCEDIKETTISQHVTTVDYLEDMKALSSMPIEILKEEAEDKSSDTQEASEQYENEAKDKIEQKAGECVNTSVSSFSEAENTEEIKSSVERDEKNEQVHEESYSEKVEFEGVELYNKDKDQEKEQELSMSEKSQGGEDDVTSSQNVSSEVIEETAFQHATTVAYFQAEQGVNATPKDIQKEEAEDTTTEEVKPKAEDTTIEEVKPSVETTDDCITSQTKSQVESAEHEVKGDNVVHSDDSPMENLDGLSVKEVPEEADSEKVEYKEEVKEKIETLSKNEDQENAQELSMPKKDQGEDQVTCSQDAAAASEEKLHGENYDGEGNDHKFVETREIIKEDNELRKISVETEERIEQEGLLDAITTDVSISAQTESQEETNENEEKKKESIESDDWGMEKPLIPSVKEVCDETSSEKVESEEVVKPIPTLKDEDQEKDQEVNMSTEDQGKDDVIATDICSSAQTETKEETVENEEKISEAEDKSIDAQEILKAVGETPTMKQDFQESQSETNKEAEAKLDAENQADKTEDKSVMKDDIILTEKTSSEPGQPITIIENTEDEIPKKDENLSHDSIEDRKDNASEEEKCSLDGRTREIEPVEEQNGGLDETIKVEPQEDTTLSSSLGPSTEDAPNSEKEKAESKIFPIEDLESVSEEQIPGGVLKSEDSNLKEECLIPETATDVDEEKEIVTKEISSDEMKSAQDQKEIADEISYPDPVSVGNPEVTEMTVDAQTAQEDLEAAEDISCESKASSTIQALEMDTVEGPEKSVSIIGEVKNENEDEAPKEERIPALEDAATLEPQVNLPNTESTIYPSETEKSSKEALEPVCDVQTPEVVADSEDLKVKEECIVSAQAVNMDENNEEEPEIRSTENIERHGEVKPTSEPVIEEDQVKETKPQPEQSDFTYESIMKDQISESRLDYTSEKNVVDEKRDMEEDVTLAPENQIDNIENQNETSKNAILTNEIEQVAVETGKEKGENEVEGQVSGEDNCPTVLSNEKELPDEIEYSKPMPVENNEVIEVKAESQIDDASIDEASKDEITPVLENAKALELPVKLQDTPSKDQDSMNLNEGAPCSTQETIEEKSVLIKESYIKEEAQGNFGVENKEAKNGNEVVEDVIVNEVLMEVENAKESKNIKDNIKEEDSCLHNQLTTATDEVCQTKKLNSSPNELLGTKDSVEDKELMAKNINLEGDSFTAMKGSNEDMKEDVEKSREIIASEFEKLEFLVTEEMTMEEDANKEKETLDKPQADDPAKTNFDSVSSSTGQGIEVRSEESRGHGDMHKLEEKPTECSEIQQQHLSTKEATLGSINQDIKSDETAREETSPEAAIPIEDVKSSDVELQDDIDVPVPKTRNSDVKTEDLEVPSLMDAVVGKAGYNKDPNVKTGDVYEAEKGVLKKDMNLESACDTSKTTEEVSGMKQVISSPTEYSENKPTAKPLISESEDKASGIEPQCSSEVLKEEKKMSDENEKPQAAEPAKILLGDMLQEKTKGSPEVAENLIEERETSLTKDQKIDKDEIGNNGAKTDEENEEEDEEDDQKLGSCSDAPVMVEASKDIEVKTPKKSHNILSGVGSKVKHSIAKVKKAITGKSSHPKPSSPKETDKVIT